MQDTLIAADTTSPHAFPGDEADAELARSAAAGSRPACTAIWRKYAPLVRSKLRRSVGGPDVEDHVQDVFSRLFESLPHLRKPAALRSFLIGIALRVAGTELRRRHGQSWLRLTVDGEHPEAIDWNADDPARREALSRLDVILEKLGPHGRRVFELRYVEGKELVEVARLMQISLATTKRHLSRVSLRLFSMVDREPALTEYFKPTSAGFRPRPGERSRETRASALQETLIRRKAARAAKAVKLPLSLEQASTTPRQIRGRAVRTTAAVVALAATAACAHPASEGFASASVSGASASGTDNNAFVVDTEAGNGPLTTPPPVGPGACLSVRACDPTCTDFPATPMLDASPAGGTAATPADAPTHFNTPGVASGGPCIVEPGSGALLPHNWVRPRFRYVPTDPRQTLFEIRISSARQKNDLVVYTTSTTWTLPAAMWRALAASTWDEDIAVTVSGVDPTNNAARPAASQIHFRIAPAPANGSMIYWAAIGDKNGDSWLEGFSVGDESVASVLTPGQVIENMSRDQGGNLQPKTQCIGCHAAVPDKSSVTFLDFYPWPGVASAVDPTHTGQVPSWLTPGGAEAMSQPWLGMMTFSAATWGAGRHVVIASYQVPPGSIPWQGAWSNAPNARLAWIDLSTSAAPVLVGGAGTLPSLDQQHIQSLTANEGKSYGFLARTGDSRGAACPTWSHDGQTVVYVSTDAAKDGRLAQGKADLYSVPYGGNRGGPATPIAGASDPSVSEYYPWFSPDDKYLAFNRSPGSDSMYYDPSAEVYVVPAAGGTAVRLSANDPPACTGTTSPGVTNSWAKWAPQSTSCGGKTYYWLIFSSTRAKVPFNAANFKAGLLYQNEPTSQLYLTAVVDDGTGHLTTYPGVYIWNQPTTSTMSPGSNQSNHTPLWDVVSIPPPPPPR